MMDGRRARLPGLAAYRAHAATRAAYAGGGRAASRAADAAAYLRARRSAPCLACAGGPALPPPATRRPSPSWAASWLGLGLGLA